MWTHAAGVCRTDLNDKRLTVEHMVLAMAEVSDDNHSMQHHSAVQSTARSTIVQYKAQHAAP
jgi:sarcosine oxidase delta subunit